MISNWISFWGVYTDCILLDKVIINSSFQCIITMEKEFIERIDRDNQDIIFVSFLKWPIVTTWEKNDKEAGDVIHACVSIHQVALCLLSLPFYQAHIHDITSGHSPHPYSLSWSPSDWPLDNHFHSFRLTHSFLSFSLVSVFTIFILLTPSTI
jgi:hypothetical protein